MKTTFLCYTPFTGLGNFGGFRGNRWLKNRITIFKQFVIPSLLTQSDRNFIHWISWRREERNNPLVRELAVYLRKISQYRFIFTFNGVCFYDDKFPEDVAKERLIDNLHGTLGELINVIGECDSVMMMITPSDDLYHKNTIRDIKENFLKSSHLQALGFGKGYICNYLTLETAKYNPTTNPPFYTIKFPREVFIDALRHTNYTSLKHDAGIYKKGVPLPSHEYVGDVFNNNYQIMQERGFLVGVHGENISTHFDHPFKGATVSKEVLLKFGIYNVASLQMPFSWRKIVFNKLPYEVKRKLRYWAGEKQWMMRPIFSMLYNFLRS